MPGQYIGFVRFQSAPAMMLSYSSASAKTRNSSVVGASRLQVGSVLDGCRSISEATIHVR